MAPGNAVHLCRKAVWEGAATPCRGAAGSRSPSGGGQVTTSEGDRPPRTREADGRFCNTLLASWAGLCPGNHESAGNRRSGRTRKGSPWLRACLVQAAHAAARTKGTYLAAQYRRLATRRGRAKAAVAVAHSILIIAYHVLTEGTVYCDLGGNYFDERDCQAVERRLVHRLQGLGYTVSLTPAA
jgi:hypothetical protein